MTDDTHNKLFGRQNGYTLISVAISIIIVGLLMAAAIQAYSTYQEKQKIEQTENRVQLAVSEIQKFRTMYGRYPCPSSLTASRSASSYGQEVESDCASATIPTGSCSGGLCVIPSDPTRVAISPTVRIGAVPFRALQMDEKDTYDAYGSRLLYAVTEKLAVEATFKETEGGINIIDENGNDVISPKGTANYVIVSHGPNRIGAFSIEGTQQSPCPALGTTLDANNCVDMSSPPTVASFRSSFLSLAGGVTEFDDTIDYFATLFDPTWKRTTGNSENIEALITNNLGAGLSSPTSALEISSNSATPGGFGSGATWDGGLRVSSDSTDSNLQANRFCQQDGTQCFDVTDITGSTGIKCTNPGEYMIGIEGNGTNAVAKCAPVKVTCDPGKVMTGVNSSGDPICTAVALNCPAGTVQICSTSGTFYPRNSNQIQTNAISISGGVNTSTQNLTDTTAYSFTANQKKARFKCDNGIWKYNYDLGGFCGNQCTIPPWAGPPPYTGTNTTTGTAACAGAMSPYETTNTETTCSFILASCTTPCTTVQDPCNCAAYFPVVMGNPTTGMSGNPPPAQPSTSVASCGAGYNTGNKSTPYIWDSSDAVCNWKPGATSNTCACDPSLAGSGPTPATVACSSLITGTTGTATEVWAFDSGTGPGHCTWKMTGYDTSSCSCDTTTEHISSLTHASICNTACDVELTPTVWAYKYKVDFMGNCVKDTDYIKTPATCGPKNFSWTPIMLLDSDIGGPSGNACGDGCRTSPASPPSTVPPYTVVGGSACPERNSTGSCWKAEGTYKSYSAKCQP